MNTTTHFDPWHDRHTINMEPDQMDKFSDEDSLFAGQPNEKQYAIADALDSLRIYIAGDTEVIPEMANIKDIDIAFLPCNQPYTMTPGQLIEAARIIQPKVLFPYHYSETDLSAIPAQLPDIDLRIRHYE